MLSNFGNNWIKKIPPTAKLYSLRPHPIPNWTTCRPITYTNMKTVTCTTVLHCICYNPVSSKFITHTSDCCVLFVINFQLNFDGVSEHRVYVKRASRRTPARTEHLVKNIIPNWSTAFYYCNNGPFSPMTLEHNTGNRGTVEAIYNGLVLSSHPL